MQSRGTILYIDDEKRNLEGFLHSFNDEYTIYITESTDEGLCIIKEKTVEVLISDLKMPDITGLDFIRKVKTESPNIVCIIVTAYGDMNSLLEAINQGNIFRYILKPWDERELQHAMNSAIDLHRLRIQNENMVKLLRKQNRQLRNANALVKQSNHLISGFLANLNHEIRTPMNGIIGFCELLTNSNLNEERRKYFVSIIKDNSYRLLNIVNSILDLSRLEAGMVAITRDNVDINILFDDIAIVGKSLLANKNVDFRVFTELDQCIIVSDRFHLNRILNLLLDNAIKFTEKGKIEIGYITDNSEIVFYVKDTGIGISSKTKKCIFECFYQQEYALIREYDGLGVGLTIANHLVRLLGGKIWLKTQPGKGSTFFFSVPVNIITSRRKSIKRMVRSKK
ncbi:MAG: hybrid sensor histidine kinase/response regulator [Bacteroidales bacterium]|nr:hybrid sensor histidine kinase/response regulator [Bacteroidales bacterium]